MHLINTAYNVTATHFFDPFARPGPNQINYASHAAPHSR